MVIIGGGFTVEDYEAMDLRDRHYITKKLMEKREFDRVKTTLDMAEAVRMGQYALMSTKKNNRPHRDYRSWRRRLENAINPEIAEMKIKEYWENMKRSNKIN